MASTEFRLSYPECLALLTERLGEPPPGRIQLLSGPRQVGKTTLLLELAQAIGEAAIYAPADDPGSALPGFWERLWERAESVAKKVGLAVVLLDEAHLLTDWAGRLKGVWDRLRRHRIPVHVVATGSSALRLASGSRESLAGRFERITLTHWTASSLVQVFKIPPEEAAMRIVSQGSYPGAFALRDDARRWSAYIRDAIVEPAIGRDILSLARVRRPALLRQVFGVCASSPAQIVSLQKIQGQLHDAGALETIANYLRLLEEAYLVAPLAKHAVRATRQRSAPPKLVTLTNALCASVDVRGAPDPATEPDRFGSWVENACLAHAWNAGQKVSYWREEPLEVDGILQGSWGSWAVEVKTGRFQLSNLKGLMEFTRRHRGFVPLVICERRSLATAERAGLQAVTWQKFLLDGTPR